MQLGAQVLGEVRILADGRPIDLGGPRQRRLLAALLVNHGSPMSTDRLVEAVFDGDPPDAAWRTFRTYVSRLRRSLETGGVDGSAVVLTVPSGYATSADLDIDSVRFERLLRDARRQVAEHDLDGALTTLDQALGLWSGSAYVEFADAEWARPEAVRLDELRVVARELHARAMVDSGRHAEAIAEIQALIVTEPLREEPQRLLMLALYRSGRHAEALRAGRAFRAQLADETGLDWGPAMVELEQMIIDRDPRLDPSPPGRRLRDYVLGDVLASTPHGVTYRASQPSLGRDVAITVIPAERADDPEFVRRFETHARRIASIHHPNVVATYDYWREPGGAYVVTRYLPGGTLAARLEDGSLVDAEMASRTVLDVGEALLAAAEHGVHHGRLTPAAVLFDERGGACLAGFALDEVADAEALDVAAYAAIAELLWQRVAERVPADGATGPASIVRDVAARARGPTGASTIGELVEELVAASRGERISAGHAFLLEPPSRVRNPYRGLHAFDETDADIFFGRRALVEQLAVDLRRDSFVALVGPSGSGKSSVVRAGLVPELRASGAYVATMVPGRHPVAQLEIALSRVAVERVPDLTPLLDRPDGLTSVLTDVLPAAAPRLVLVVDQLEEAVTMSDPDERDLLFGAIAREVRESGGRLQVVATARADFLGRLLDHPVIGPLVRDASRLIAPLDADELHQAVVEPAALAGVIVESELATALVADSADAPGSLPLLQFALTELFERRADGAMTLAAYREMGGLGSTLARRAEDVYGALVDDDRLAARRLFSRLVTLGEGAEDTRRRVVRSELASVSPAVVDDFAAARLLTLDHEPRTREPTVEIAHEALIANWPRLRSWIDEDRSGLLLLRHLTAASRAWDDAGREPGELYRGGRLATAAEWAERHEDDLTPLELAFLEASTRARDDELERDRRRTRRLRLLASGLAVIAVIALIAVAVAVLQRNRADSNASEAERRTIEAEQSRVEADAQRLEADRSRVDAEVQRLVAEANATLDEDPDLPILLALEAYDRQQRSGEEPPGSVIATLQTTVQNSRILHRSDDGALGAMALSPDGETMVLGSAEDPTTAVVLDVESGAEIGRIETGLEIGWMEIDPRGERLAVLNLGSRPNPAFSLYDLATLDLIGQRGAELNERPRFSPGWRYVATIDPDARGPGEVPQKSVVWDLSEPDCPSKHHLGVNVGGWMPDGETLVVHDENTIRFVDPLTGDDRRAPLVVGTMCSVDVHPVREELLVVGDDLELWRPDAAAPFQVFPGGNVVRHNSFGTFTPDGSRIVVHGSDDEIRVIDPATGDTLALKGNQNAPEVSVSADGTTLLSGGDDGSILWDLTRDGPTELGNLPSAGVLRHVVLDRDASTATVAESGLGADGSRGRVRRFDLDSGAVLASSAEFDAREHVTTSNEGWFAYATPGGPASIGHVDDEAVAIEVGRCDLPWAMDDRGRWLLIATDDTRCRPANARIVDPSTGEVILEFDRHHSHFAEFGPSGTIAEGLLAYQAEDTLGSSPLGIVLRRIAPDDEILGVVHGLDSIWKPQFSADGRFLSFGSADSGAYAVDIEQVLAGVPMNDAIVAHARGAGGPATFPVVGDGSLVMGQSGDVLRFHDLDSGAEWMTFPVDTGLSTNFRFTADHSVMYYEAAGGVLRRFPLDHEELAELARERVQRDFSEAECLRFAIVDDCSPYATA